MVKKYSLNEIVNALKGSQEWQDAVENSRATLRGYPNFEVVLTVLRTLYPKTHETILADHAVRDIRDAALKP